MTDYGDNALPAPQIRPATLHNLRGMGNHPLLKIEIVATALATLLGATTAAAQAPIVMILPVPQSIPDRCYNPNLPQKPKVLEDRLARAEAAIQAYVTLAAANADLSAAFVEKKKGLLLIDGNQQPVQSYRDPWAARVARVERIGFAVSNLSNYHYEAAWRAVAADGSTLGYYDASFQWAAKGRGSLIVLKLSSPTAPPPKVGRHCKINGDIENPNLRF